MRGSPGTAGPFVHAVHFGLRRQPPARREQALQQARLHRRRLPAAGRAHQRGRSRRDHPPRGRAHQPRHRLPHAAVDGRGGHRPQGRLRRRPLPLRALLPPPAPLPPDLQELQQLLRVPQLGHRGADRGSGLGARLQPAPERGPDLRHLRGLPDRAPGDRGRGPAGAAVRPRRPAHRHRHRAQRPRLLHPRRPDHARRAGPHGLPQAVRGGGRAPRPAGGAATASCWRSIRSSRRGRRSCSSRAPPTACSRKARKRCRASPAIARR